MVKNVAKRWLPARLRMRPGRRRYVEGLPDGAPVDQIESVVFDLFDDRGTDYRYELISGWKSTGAYRLEFTTGLGVRTLIYKNALYSDDVTPAAQRFPFRPGPAEYDILTRGDQLADILPRVYCASEIDPGVHYHFIMEDLAADFRSIWTTGDILLVAEELPELHDTLSGIDPEGLHRIHAVDDQAVIAYSLESLSNFHEHVRFRIVDELTERWGDVEAAWPRDGSALIHGDLNSANVLMSRDGPKAVRVIDWEWARFGRPMDDLAALLKIADRRLERDALTAYADALGCEPDEPMQTEYQRSRLSRLIVDAAYLADQLLNEDEPADWLQRSILGSVRDASRALDEIHRLES